MSVHSRYQKLVEDQRQFFDDLITEEWDSYQNEAWDFSRRFELERVLDGVTPARVLDIGCGCGFHDVELAQRPFVEAVDGIDYSSASIDKANAAYPHPKVRRWVADLRTDQPDPVYDLVMSFQVIEHLADPSSFMRFAAAACRTGGRVAVVTPNRDRLDNRLRTWRGEPPTMVDPQHFHEYSIRELADLGRAHGLLPCDSFGYGFQSLLMSSLTPRDHRRATRLGAWLPRLANVIGVIYEKPAAVRASIDD